MPSFYITDTIKFEYDSDEPYIPNLSAYLRRHPPPGKRPIAGSRRAARYLSEHGYTDSGQLLQSITAHPALSTWSFEELRLECYAQSFVAQGRSPAPVNAVTTPGAVIPPLFKAYRDETDDVLYNEITMAD